jgi:FO synthase
LTEYRELVARWRELAPDVAIQIPPNLNPFWRELLPEVDDLGGISSEGDLINPTSPWSQIDHYREAAQACGRDLIERLPVYPKFIHPDWQSTNLWPKLKPISHVKPRPIWDLPTEELQQAAAALNTELNGHIVTYVVNRNANFTNICNIGCAFCGFQRRASDTEAYTRTAQEIIARLELSPDITEVCMQGGINPALPFAFYRDLLVTIKTWRPDLHIHAFSPMEIESLRVKTGWSCEKVLAELQAAGLGSIPGTAAEILVDDVRHRISSRKLGTQQWHHIIRTAHRLGLRSSATVMYGHVETWEHLRTHFEILRSIQEETGGFTEFVPLQFVPFENPLGHDIRPDPRSVEAKTARLYPLARLYFGSLIPHLQTSWVKLGLAQATETLSWGCDDFGGTLMEESITRASGGQHGESLTAVEIEAAVLATGKTPRQRTTLYQTVEHVLV